MLSSLLLLASSDTTVVEDVTEGASETVENVADSAVDQLQSFGDLFSFFNLSSAKPPKICFYPRRRIITLRIFPRTEPK